MYLSLEITEKMQKWAKERSEASDEVNPERYEGGMDSQKKNNAVGSVGEAIFWKFFFDYILSHTNASGYDFVMKNGLLVDVKTAVTDYYPPEPTHYVQLTKANHVRYQKPVIFFWIHIDRQMRWAALVGFIAAKKFDNICTFGKKGERRSADDPFIFTADTIETMVKNLEPAENLVTECPPCNSCLRYGFNKGLDPYCELKEKLISERRWPAGCAAHIDRYAKVLPKQRG